ncbi:MAG: hypothetical protein K0V04_41235 [Deltaproteobacteria bacterium]|nr:hypothetical protein [Deltaproteobacteria bacterium]
MPRKQESAFVDWRYRPIVIGHLPHEVLPPLVEPLAAARPGLTALQARLLRLAAVALHDVLQTNVDPEASPGDNEPRHRSAALPEGLDPPAPLWVAGPRPADGRPPIMTGRFIGQLLLQAGVGLLPAASRVFASGRAGLFAALRHAQANLGGAGMPQLGVVGGVDSYVDPVRLAALLRDDRLLTEGVQDAFTPGEAAAFMLVATPAACRRYGYAPLAYVDAVGLGREPGHHGSSAPHRGDGLATAVREALDQRATGASPVRLVMAGLNGERAFAKEWGVAHRRNHRHFAPGLRIEHSAEYIGDAGAALAPTMLGITALGLRDSVVQGPALVWGSSDFGDCGALVLTPA